MHNAYKIWMYYMYFFVQNHKTEDEIMENKRKTPESKLRANKKHNAKAYDVATIRLRKGIKPAILAAGYTTSGYITRAVINQMKADGITAYPQEEAE